MAQQTERRRYKRYSADGLKVTVTSITGSGQQEVSSEAKLKQPSLIPMDFNQHGIAVLTPHLFQIGQRLALQVREEGGSMLEVDGVIMSRCRQESWYRCGLTFDYKYSGDNLMNTALVELEHQAIN